MAPSFLILRHQKGSWAAARSAATLQRGLLLEASGYADALQLQKEPLSKKVGAAAGLELERHQDACTWLQCCFSLHVQLSVTLPPFAQPQSPNQRGCLFSFIKGAGLRGEVGTVPSAGGIFSSYGKH